MNVWEQYKNQSEKKIVRDLLQEEINQLEGNPEQIIFSSVIRKRLWTAIFWGLLTLALLIRYIATDSLDRDFRDAVPPILMGLIWLFRVCKVNYKKAAKCMVRDAMKSPEKPFSQVVSDNIQLTEAWISSKSAHVLLCLLLIFASLGIAVGDRLSEMRVDGMIFKNGQKGCVLVNCVANFTGAHVEIPSHVEGKRVVAIDSGAFMNEQTIVSVNMPDTVISIGAEAFSGCTNLKSIVISENVVEIRGNCFENCTSLTEINLPESITAIHGYAFRNCSSLEQIDLPGGITEIRGNCFENCTNLKSIVIPEGVTRIGGHAFMGCTSLSSVTVPNTVQSIGSSAFRQCRSRRRIEIPANASVDERAFKESPTIIYHLDEKDK